MGGAAEEVLTTAPNLRPEAKSENFPVASLLLARRVRPHVVAFYNFVRAADNAADDPTLSPAAKLERLDAFADGLDRPGPTAPDEARVLASSIDATGAGRAEAEALLSAFRQDAVKARYADLDELADYCRRSADPVGRYLLRLHGEGEEGFPASDALCTALQVLNHLQDCGLDRRRMDRVYLPLDLLARHGALVPDLDRPAATPSLRAALDALLDDADRRLEAASALPRQLRDRRLRMEAGAVLANARVLARLLRRGDPLAGRVAQTFYGKLMTALNGALRAFR